GNLCIGAVCQACRANDQSCSASSDCCSGLACFNGACAPCVADGKTCSANADCCAGLGCYNGACALCVTDGQTCSSDGQCCSGAVCREGACATPKTVKTGEACIEGFDSCENEDAACESYEFDDPEGTYCLLPRKARCTGDMDCRSRDCENRVCIACSHEACITACTPIVCKSGCTYSTVQAAITNASPNAVIDIGPGTYVEDLVIDKNLTLRACKGTEVILRNASYNSRTISSHGLIMLGLIDIIVDGRNDPDNDQWGGGIHVLVGMVALFRNTVIRNAAWPYGGGLMLGSEQEITGGSIDPGLLQQSGGKAALERSPFAGLERRLPEWLRSEGSRITPSDYNPTPAFVYLVDQSSIQNNSATWFGGGIFASFEGLPISLIPDAPLFPVVFMFHAATIKDNQVTSTTAPRELVQPQGPVIRTDYGGGGIFGVNGLVVMDDDSRIDRNIADVQGGGIMLLPALLFTGGSSFPYSIGIGGNARISRNTAFLGGGVSIVDGPYIPLGGLYLTENASVDANSADAAGGGAFLQGVPLYLLGESVITGNSAGVSGGGAIVIGPFDGGSDFGAGMGDDATISGNTAANGAGLYLDGTRLTMEDNAAIRDNIASETGGGVYLDFTDDATGYAASVEMEDMSIITGNVAGDGLPGAGGGVYSDNDSNGVIVISAEGITENNPDNCVGSVASDCVA
ncbi:MAG: Dickkopf N-terminal cysteine-rich domain-containing protein, partial [Chloroflexota bacterium]